MPTACKTLGHQTGSSLPELQSGRGERDRYGRCAGRYTWIKISHSHPLSPTPFSATWHQKVMTEKHGFTSCFEIPYPLYLFLIQLCGVNIIISTWYRNNKTGDKTGVNIYWALIVHQALNYFSNSDSLLWSPYPIRQLVYLPHFTDEEIEAKWLV